MPKNFEIVADVKTERTGLDGKRHAAWGVPQSAIAPEGYAIDDSTFNESTNPDGLKLEYLPGCKGDKNDYKLEKFDFVPVKTGRSKVTNYPRRIVLTAWAQSRSGHNAGPGITYIKASGTWFEY